jgi:hypothetical protein
MRATALAAATAGLALIGVAEARPWADPAGRLTFDAPAGWSINQRTDGGPNLTYVLAGTANNECQFLVVPNPATTTARVGHIRTQGADPARFSNDLWTRALGQFPELVRNGATITVQSTSVENTGFWPIQRAEARSNDQAVHAAIQVRPGLEIFTACLTYGGADATATYDQVIRSIGHPNDATWQAAAETEAAAPPPPPPPPAPPPEENRRRNRDR